MGAKLAGQNSNRGDAGDGRKDSSLVAASRQFAHYATVGIMFPVAIGLGFVLGYLVDGWLGTTPLFALIGLAFGVAAAIRNLLQAVASDDGSTGKGADDGRS